MHHLSTRFRSARGFTLIELLVVIAIIGILSSVVLASLNSARTKGTDAAIKSNLVNSRAQAELFYDSNANSYLNVCTNTSAGGVKSIYSQVLAAANNAGIASITRNGAGAAGVAVCNDAVGNWAAQVPLKTTTNTFLCVDNTGDVEISTGTRIANATDYICSS
jgi:prepilin-type N-terminal cleavage/methylation domain-containing protein